MLSFLISMALGILVIASALQLFSIVRHEEIKLRVFEAKSTATMQAVLYLKHLAAQAGNDFCGANWSHSIWLNSSVPKAFEVIDPNSSRLINDLEIMRRGSGQLHGGSIISMSFVSPGSKVLARFSPTRFLVKDPIRLKSNETVLLTDCSENWLAVVKSDRPDGKNLIVSFEQEIPWRFQAGGFIEPWHHQVLYVGRLPKSRKDENALFKKSFTGRREELIPGINLLHLTVLKPHVWSLSLNKRQELLVAK